MTRGLPFLLAVAALVAGCNAGAKHPVSWPQHFADEDASSDIDSYSIAWTALLGDCKGTPTLIARYVDNTTDLYGRQGQSQTHLEVMEAMASAADPVAPTDCDQIGAALLTLSGG